MELSYLLNYIKVIQVVGKVEQRDISGIAYNSKNVVKNNIFVAIKGVNVDGHKFIMDAMNNGAIAVVVEDDSVIPDYIFEHRNVTKILVENSRKTLAKLSHVFYKEPTNKLDLIGITGTNGKTTTTYIIRKILQTDHRKVGLIGTIANFIDNEKIDTNLTTPESVELNQLFKNMVDKGCQNAVMEVSSHSLVMNRVYGLNFKVAIFSNLTQDHLDFHKTMDEYAKAKKILFDNLDENAYSVVNYDDQYSQFMIKDTKSKVYTYGFDDGCDFQILDLSNSLNGLSFKIKYQEQIFNVKSKLIGKFNAYNITAAFVSTFLLGIEPQIILKAIEDFEGVSGRFQVLKNKNKTVVIDYSHTPDSLQKALSTLNELTNNPIYCVFGAGGDRDKTKRPIMGKIASELSKKVFVTSDNPRTEDPEKIIDDIIAGIKYDNFIRISDRENAIKEAILNTEDNAVILIAGKGHEDYQIIGKTKIHFSDAEIANKYLELL